ncbi:MAG: protein-L-isoaspartate O-methyltransferase [Flavobacteriaceae bacterium]|nr:protein-L-isoaspartate O-methyltransferase [Flavobacteriaceae bacterium]|tara:strand:+ start:30350 stop:30991 length:642 start_codon:yes stop_codon:yes gene_type:complete
MVDNNKHKGLRRQLVKKLINKGISNKDVLNSIKSIPRHLFMEKGLEPFAYEDKAYPIAAEQTISQPYTVAFQTELLNLKKGDKVLEIGTGSGYQTSILVNLGCKVYSIERQSKLFKKTNLLLSKIGYMPKKIIFGDGYKGLPEFAPYDGIIVTAGSEEIPKALLSQIKLGGCLVIPVGIKTQVMTRVKREEEKKFTKETFGEFRFVPLLKDKI